MRFAVQRLMVAVAISAAVLTAIQRRLEFQERCRSHRNKAGEARIASLNRYLELDAFQPTETCAVFIDPSARSDVRVQRYGRLADYHEALARKYDRAARRPWWPVAPDPPEPN
jgi:hypothetical protein